MFTNEGIDAHKHYVYIHDRFDKVVKIFHQIRKEKMIYQKYDEVNLSITIQDILITDHDDDDMVIIASKIRDHSNVKMKDMEKFHSDHVIGIKSCPKYDTASFVEMGLTNMFANIVCFVGTRLSSSMKFRSEAKQDRNDEWSGNSGVTA